MSTKTCNTCQEIKDITLFSIKKGVYLSQCKACRNAKLREKYKSEEQKKKTLAYNRSQYKKHSIKIMEQHKEYVKNNLEVIKQRRSKYWFENKERLTAKHKEFLKTYYTKYPERRLSHSARRRANKLLRGDTNIDEYLDCTNEWFQDWIFYCIAENGWTDMTMDNYGTIWHLDHVVPCAKWNLSDPDHKANCFHWSNIAPMYAKINNGKKDKIDKAQIARQNQLLDQFCSSRMVDEMYFQITFPEDLAKPTIAGSPLEP